MTRVIVAEDFVEKLDDEILRELVQVEPVDHLRECLRRIVEIKLAISANQSFIDYAINSAIIGDYVSPGNLENFGSILEKKMRREFHILHILVT